MTRPAILRELVIECVRAGWKLETIADHAPKLADVILGSAPAITPEVAVALDRALNETAAAVAPTPTAAQAGAVHAPQAPTAPAATNGRGEATTTSDTEAQHDTIAAEGDGGAVRSTIADTGVSPPPAAKKPRGFWSSSEGLSILRDAARRGLTQQEAADALGIGTNIISYNIRGTGIAFKLGRPGPTLKVEREAELRRLAAQKVTMPEAAERMGLAYETVKGYAAKYGIRFPRAKNGTVPKTDHVAANQAAAKKLPPDAPIVDTAPPADAPHGKETPTTFGRRLDRRCLCGRMFKTDRVNETVCPACVSGPRAVVEGGKGTGL